jgi:DNA topoisomerase I
LSLKLGRFGSFVGCTNYPTCNFTRPLSTNAESAANHVPADGILLGEDPETGLPVTRRAGRFGPYVQLGQAVEGEKPQRASIPARTDVNTLDLETALKLLSLPREVGIHPETKTPITANFGRFGAYIKHDGVYANLESPEDVFTIGLNHAVAKMAEKRAKGPSARSKPTALKNLGAHPDGEGDIEVFTGKYGAYVKHNGTNATLQGEQTPENITLDQAVMLIAEREAKGGGKKKRPAKKAAAKKVPAKKKAPAKKAAKKAVKKAKVNAAE